ncbi:bZIP transcription factor [Idiomarina xiamenensis]|uniref:Peptidase n=1 Tax=Idiomarina xiamenensis 10-D-4 TaxID=740709 RepID=K2JW53_9GAMM|nr:bZIP transcription factor [Idiomarina xiamenensis]EKE79713.1 hypothetical protein A10D4_12674 [Idiomarina xiamenensis 10-D-4]
MKRINIFKTGTHTSSDGQTLEFGEDLLQSSAESYDPALHEAPIVIGHPKSNGPAYGWVNGIEFSEGSLDAIPHQINTDFEEMVSAGAFKKVSASFYLPDAPNNPKPGTLYLRHVGFFGAHPPAIKGLKPVEFSEAEEGIVEFEDRWQHGWTLKGIGDALKNLREFIIDKFSKDEADKAIPNYLLDDLNKSADSFMKNDDTPVTDFSESDKPDPETVDMKEIEELKAKVASLEADKTQLSDKNGELEKAVASFKEAEQKRQRAELTARVDALVAGGKIKPADKSRVLAFAERLANQTVDFGEGENEKGLDAQDQFLKQFEEGKAVLNFEEQSGDDTDPPTPVTARSLSTKAVEYQEQERKAGRVISIAEAVDHVSKDAE